MILIVLPLAVVTASASEQTFVNTNWIFILDATNAVPYPSSINVAGFTEVVDKVTVTINDFTHPNPQDVDLLLVGPGGRSAILMSDAGLTGTNQSPSVTNLTLTFDATAPVQLRQLGPLSSGTFRPADFLPADSFPTNAPAGPYGTDLTVFKETDPNGTWNLYAVDDQAGGFGVIGSWSLTISAHSQVFSNSVPIVISNTAALGTPYPSAIEVTNIADPITKVTVTLLGLTHGVPSDLDVLLVGPAGGSVVLMSDAGGGSGATNVTLTFDDAAIMSLPTNTLPQFGFFQPTDYPGSDLFTNPAPASPYDSALSVFNGQSPNGIWQLFVVDDFPAANGGQITGWKLAISSERLAIVRQPEDVTVALGSNATLYVSVAGVEPITYQWRHNGFHIAGATNASFTVSSVSVADGGSYSVSVANAYGTIYSENARLLLDYPLSAAPDNFTASSVLVGSSGIVVGTNFFAAKEVDEPYHAGKPGGSSVWYAWTPTATGIATVDTRGSTFDTLLGVYGGTSLSNLAVVARNDDSGGYFTSKASFNVAANRIYWIAVDGLGGKQGTFVFNWELEKTTDLLPVFTHPSLGQTVAAGDTAVMSLTAAGPGLTFQWYLNGSALAGATNASLIVSNAQIENVGTYELAATTSAGRMAKSEPMLLEIGSDPGVQSRYKPEDLMFPGEAFASQTGPSAAGAGDLIPYTFAFVAPGTSRGQLVVNTYGGGGSIDYGCELDVSTKRYYGVIAQDDGEFVFSTRGSPRPVRIEIDQFVEPNHVYCITSSEGFPAVARVTASNGERLMIVTDEDRNAVGGSGQPTSIVINWAFGANLSISLTNEDEAVLSWVAASDAYQLEFTPELSPALWSPVTDASPVEFHGGTNVAVVPVMHPPDRPTDRWFRLKKRAAD